MKQLLIMRHAKSDWSDRSVSDFERPLNKRGKKAAPFMGKELLKRGLVPEIIYSSPAKRAKMTAEAFAENCKYNKDIIIDENFYFGSLKDVMRRIKETPDELQRVMVVGHNPTWESLLTTLSGSYDSMPTACVALLEFDDSDWKNLKEKSCKLKFILKPKEIM